MSSLSPDWNIEYGIDQKLLVKPISLYIFENMKNIMGILLLMLGMFSKSAWSDATCKFAKPLVKVTKQGNEYVIDVTPQTASGVCYTAIVPDRTVSNVILWPDQNGFKYKTIEEPKYTYKVIIAARYKTTQTGKVRLLFIDKKAQTMNYAFDFALP